MLHLNIQGLRNKSGWQAAHIALPRYDVSAMQERTLRHPVWIHFGAGNIFRARMGSSSQLSVRIDRSNNSSFHGINPLWNSR